MSSALMNRQLPAVPNGLFPDLRVCTLCYHPGEILRLKCRHTVCVECTKTKLSTITPSRLSGKIFCPICGFFVGQQAETAEIATQTWGFNAKMDHYSSSRRSSYDSGFEDIQEDPLSTSTPIGKLNKRLFDFTGGPNVRTISEEDAFDLSSDEEEGRRIDNDATHSRCSADEIDDLDKERFDKRYTDDDTSDMESTGSSKSYMVREDRNKHSFGHIQKSDEPAQESKPKCHEHSHCTSKYFCQSCEEHICLGCKVGEHKRHQVIPIKALNKIRISARQDDDDLTNQNDMIFPGPADDHVLELQAWIEELENYTNLLQQKQQKAMKSLTDRRNYLREFVDRWFSKTSLQIETLFQKEITGIEDTVQQIKDSIKNHKDLSKDTNNVTLEHLGPANFASIAEDFTVVMSSGVGLTNEMLGSFSASSVKSNNEPSKPSLDSTFEDSLSLSSLPSASSMSQCSSCSIDVPSLKFLPKPSIRFVGQGQEVRAFETRDTATQNCEYMATGLSLMNDGRVLVTDMGTDCVKVFSTAGRFLSDITTLPDDQATKAIQLTSGEIAVTTKSAVKLFKDNGTFKYKAGNIQSPEAITVSSNGNILVSDMIDGVNMITTYQPDLATHAHVFNSLSQKNPDHRFHHPWYITTNSAQDIFVSDREDHTIKVYSQRGQYQWMAGGQGAGPGQLFRPAGIVVDKLGHVLVADSGNDRVQVFSPAGDWLGIILDQDQHEMDTPMDLAINSAGHLVVLQADGKVRIFRYLL